MATIRRVRRAQHPVPPAPARHGLRASAQRFNLADKKLTHAQSVPRREWQDEGWGHFDDVPEIKYSVWFEGNVMAKIRLFPAVIDPNDPDAPPIPASDPQSGLPAGVAARAQAEINRLRAPLGGRAEIIRALNMNLEVTGEGYIIGWGPREVMGADPASGVQIVVDVTDEEWGIYSVSQVEEKGGEYRVRLRPNDGAGAARLVDKEHDTIIRIFQRHPRWSLEADCNMRGVLSDCEALVLLSNSIKAEAKSRMSAGWLLIPNELSTGPDQETQPEDGEEAAIDPFLQDLYDGLVDPIEDPSSAAAVAPTFIRGPSDALKEFRHVAVVRTADEKVLEKITALIERVARGMNLPVEVVMGHQQTTFANAIQVKQDTFDDHFQPRCVLICDALTVGFLQPNLIEGGLDESIAERVIVWFDASGMIKQVNPVDSADQGITLDLISGEAWRRAWGWSEDDAPDPIERLVRAVMHLRTFDPGVSTAILDLLGVPLDIPQALPGKTTPADGTQTGTGGAAATMPGKQMGLEALLAEAIAQRYDIEGQGARATLDQLLVDLLQRDPTVVPVLAREAKAIAPPPPQNRGRDLMEIDRELRTKLLVAADQAMTRALEKAGNRLRSKQGQIRELTKGGHVHPVYFTATIGPKLVAAAGFTDDDLISVDAWAGLETSFRAWVAAAQARALNVIGHVVPLTGPQREVATQAQARALDGAWDWMRDELHKLATVRLYAPDPPEPAVGEYDPTCRVPVGLVRQALARAGGASNIEPVATVSTAMRAAGKGANTGGGVMSNPGSDAQGQPVYVATNDGAPVGGVATGETITTVLSDSGGGVDGYVWEYGPAFRKSEFEPHLSLDQVPFTNFDADVLVAGDWIGDYYFPGDHDGCQCDITPVVLDPGAFSDASAIDSGLTDLGPVPADAATAAADALPSSDQ